MLQILGQKLERTLIIEIGIALVFLSHARPKLNFPILQGNIPVWSENRSWMPHRVFSSILSKDPTRRSRLKNIVGCYHWFNVQKVQESTLWWCYRRGKIMLASRCNHKPPMGSITRTNNLNQCGVNLKVKKVKGNQHLQTPPNLWSAGQQLALPQGNTSTAHLVHTHKGPVGHYTDLAPTTPYDNLKQHKIGQCGNTSAQQPAWVEGTTTKYKKQCNNNTGSAFPKHHLSRNKNWLHPTVTRLRLVVKNKTSLLL